MSLTVPEYVEAMRERQEVLALKMGVDLHGASQETRVALTCANAMTAICYRALTLLGLVTDAQLAAEFDSAMAQVFPSEPPPGPGPDPTSGA
jgi:hypothetical protein